MRNKARLSITGSTGENGRVMTPEFPKAVHAVPYVRPDMGLNVSLTDLSWLMRNFWVPYNGFIIVIFFSYLGIFSFSLWWKGKGGRWSLNFVSHNEIFCYSHSLLLTRLPLWVELHLRLKKTETFSFLWKNTTLSYLLLDYTETEKRVWLKENACFWELEFHISPPFVHVCVGGVWKCQKYTVYLGTAAKQDFQAHCIKMWHCHFFLRKFSQKNSIKNIFMYFHKIAFKWTCLHTGWI